MICSIRLDERLIHGQVAIKWSRHMAVDRIVVANDAAASNSIVQKSLMMAAPPTAKVAIKTIADAIPLINDPRMENHRLMILVSTPEDLLTVVKAVPDIPLVNVGNYGRVAPKKEGEARKTYQKNLYLYPEEAEVLQEIIATGLNCNYQTVPDETAMDLVRAIKN